MSKARSLLFVAAILCLGGRMQGWPADVLTEWWPAGWQYLGEFTTGQSWPCLDGADLDLGAMWECPFFVPLPRGGGKGDIHILCVSPYPHHLKDRPTNPVLFWLGAFIGQQFDVSASEGRLASCCVELRRIARQYPCHTLTGLISVC